MIFERSCLQLHRQLIITVIVAVNVIVIVSVYLLSDRVNFVLSVLSVRIAFPHLECIAFYALIQHFFYKKILMFFIS